MIVLRFSRGKSFVAKGICVFTFCPFSHVDVVLPKSLQEKHGGKFLTASGVERKGNGGVIVHSESDDSVAAVKYMVVRGLTREQERQFFKFLTEQIGKQYDYLGLINVIFRTRAFNDESKWYCSKLIDKAFALIGVEVSRVSNFSCATSPADIYYDDRVQPFEGTV